MLGGFVMKDITSKAEEEKLLLEELDKGIDDMEEGRVKPHEETMKLLRQQYAEYVLQNP